MSSYVPTKEEFATENEQYKNALIDSQDILHPEMNAKEAIQSMVAAGYSERIATKVIKSYGIS